MVFDRVPACAVIRLQAIVGAMENVENDRDTPMLDWERSMLARLCVKGILHDTLYDHEVAARASVERTGPLSERPTGHGIRLREAKGEAHLVAVMEDGSRVGIPSGMPEDTPESFEDMRADPDDAIRVMLALIDGEAWTNTLLAYVDPGILQRMACKGGTLSADTNVPLVLDGMLREHYDPVVPIPRILFSWIRLLNQGIFISLESAIQLSRFMGEKCGGIHMDRIPERMMRLLRRTADDPGGSEDLQHMNSTWALQGLYRLTVGMCYGDSHVAWSFACAQFALDQDHERVRFMLTARGWLGAGDRRPADARIMLDMLTGPHTSRKAADRIDSLLGEDTDQWIMAFSLCRMLFGGKSVRNAFLREPDWDWLTNILSMAKGNDWDRLAFMQELTRRNAVAAIDITAMLLRGRAPQPYDSILKTSLAALDQPLHMLYASADALQGAKLVEEDSSLEPDDFSKRVPDEKGNMGIMFMLSRCAENTLIIQSGDNPSSFYSHFGRYEIMVLLEDLAHAHSKGVSVAEFNTFMTMLADELDSLDDESDYDDGMHSRNVIKYDGYYHSTIIICALQSIIHEIVETDPAVMKLPVSFVWNNPEMGNLVKRAVSLCRKEIVHCMPTSIGFGGNPDRIRHPVGTLPMVAKKGIPAAVNREH